MWVYPFSKFWSLVGARGCRLGVGIKNSVSNCWGFNVQNVDRCWVIVWGALCPRPPASESSREGLCVLRCPSTGIHPFRYIFNVRGNPSSLLGLDPNRHTIDTTSLQSTGSDTQTRAIQNLPNLVKTSNQRVSSLSRMELHLLRNFDVLISLLSVNRLGNFIPAKYKSLSR